MKKNIIFRGEIYSLYCTLARKINTISSLLVLMSGTSADGGAGYGSLRRSEHSHVNNVLQLRTPIILLVMVIVQYTVLLLSNILWKRRSVALWLFML